MADAAAPHAAGAAEVDAGANPIVLAGKALQKLAKKNWAVYVQLVMLVVTTGKPDQWVAVPFNKNRKKINNVTYKVRDFDDADPPEDKKYKMLTSIFFRYMVNNPAVARWRRLLRKRPLARQCGSSSGALRTLRRRSRSESSKGSCRHGSPCD